MAGRGRSSARGAPSARGGSRGRSSARGEAPAQARPAEAAAEVLPPSTLNTDRSLDAVRPFLPVPPRGGNFGIRPGLAAAPTDNLGKAFVHFLPFVVAGLVPQFSDFFMEVLRHYEVRLAHLSPNAVAALAVFAHLCEAFVGVMPCVPLFHRYFRASTTGKPGVVGCVRFTLRENTGYIEYTPNNKVESWKMKWFLMDYDDEYRRLRLPVRVAERRASWDADVTLGPEYLPVLARIAALDAAKLTSYHVVHDFLATNVAPLRQREKPSWLYRDYTFEGRTRRGKDSDLSLGNLEVACASLTGKGWREELEYPAGAEPLRSRADRVAIRSAMPTLTPRGLLSDEEVLPKSPAMGAASPRVLADTASTPLDTAAAAATTPGTVESTRGTGKERSSPPTDSSEPLRIPRKRAREGESTGPGGLAEPTGAAAKKWRRDE